MLSIAEKAQPFLLSSAVTSVSVSWPTFSQQSIALKQCDPFSRHLSVFYLFIYFMPWLISLCRPEPTAETPERATRKPQERQSHSRQASYRKNRGHTHLSIHLKLDCSYELQSSALQKNSTHFPLVEIQICSNSLQQESNVDILNCWAFLNEIIVWPLHACPV